MLVFLGFFFFFGSWTGWASCLFLPKRTSFSILTDSRAASIQTQTLAACSGPGTGGERGVIRVTISGLRYSVNWMKLPLIFLWWTLWPSISRQGPVYTKYILLSYSCWDPPTWPPSNMCDPLKRIFARVWKIRDPGVFLSPMYFHRTVGHSLGDDSQNVNSWKKSCIDSHFSPTSSL